MIEIFGIIVVLAAILTYLTWYYVVPPIANGLEEIRKIEIRRAQKEEERAQLLEDYLRKNLPQ